MGLFFYAQCLALSDLLCEHGFDCAVADNGLRALSILNAITGTEDDPLPALILLDLHMPELDGWQLHQALQEDPRFCKIPIVVISCDPHLKDVPAQAHFPKPIDPRALIAALKN